MEDLPSPCTSITPKPDSLLNPLRLSGRNDLPAQISYRYDGQNNSFTLHNLARAPGVRRARRRRGRAALARTAARSGFGRGEGGARCFGRCGEREGDRDGRGKRARRGHVEWGVGVVRVR